MNCEPAHLAELARVAAILPHPSPDWLPVAVAKAAPRHRKGLAVAMAVADAYGLSWEEITGPGRTFRVAHPRQHAFWALRQLCPHLSLPQIGMMFGKDHTTVLYGIRKHEERRSA